MSLIPERRVSLGHFPTPIHELPRLSKFLGGPKLYVKRDDLTGLAGGGNKTRKLEFSVAEALAQGADTLVTLGGVQSNHCRQTAAAAARYGLRCVLVLRGNPPLAWNGNLLLDKILGAEIRFSGTRSREEVALEVVEEERKAGRKPFFIPLGASDGIGSVGYVAAMEELALQLKGTGRFFDRIVFASSSYGTQAGICVGAKALGLPVEISPVSIDSTREELQARGIESGPGSRKAVGSACRDSSRRGPMLGWVPGRGLCRYGPSGERSDRSVRKVRGAFVGSRIYGACYGRID